MKQQDKNLKCWLIKNHPKLLKEIQQHMQAHPLSNYDLVDTCDLLNSHIYNEYCEQEK